MVLSFCGTEWRRPCLSEQCKEKGTQLRTVPDMIVTASQMDKAMREWNGSCKKLVVRITTTGRTIHVFTRQLVQTDRSRREDGTINDLVAARRSEAGESPLKKKEGQ